MVGSKAIHRCALIGDTIRAVPGLVENDATREGLETRLGCTVMRVDNEEDG